MIFVFLISDEGMGHTVRQGCIAQELISRGHNVFFQFRDPLKFAKKTLNDKIGYIDKFNLIRLVKGDGEVNIEKTLELLSSYKDRSLQWIEETSNIREVIAADVIVSDIVEEAGHVAEILNKPSVAITHFTWSWLFRKLDNRFSQITGHLQESLGKISEFWYPPFSKEPEHFPNSKSINIIARVPQSRELIRKQLGLTPKSKFVLIAGGTTQVWKGIFENLDILKNSEYKFLSDISNALGQNRHVPNPHRLHDYINAADLVVSRGGFGTISETLAYGVKHLIIQEGNHPETLANAELIRQANRAHVIQLDDFVKNAVGVIEDTFAMNLATDMLLANGQSQCADKLIELAS